MPQNVRPHDVFLAIIVLFAVVGGMIGQKFLSHHPWIAAIVGGPRLLVFLVITMGMVYFLDRWLCNTKAYRESVFMRELGRDRK